MDLKLTKWTIAACVDCGFPVVGRHNCERQRAENDEMSALGRIIFLNARGELIARLAKAKS